MLYQLFVREIDVVKRSLQVLRSTFFIAVYCMLAVVRDQSKVEVRTLKLDTVLGKLGNLLISQFGLVFWDASQ